MCYVCNCFAWTLDLLQRGITFCLTCCITCVICFGLIITVIAGVAFGYNYSFAEFITHTRSDVTVYMRRGQFYDHPDIAPPLNRRMGDEDDLFSSNATSEYEEQVISNKDSEPLAEKWLKDEDAREYALKLTKYKSNERIHADESDLNEQQKKVKPKHTSTLPSTRRLTSIPIVIPTTIWDSGSSQIILRKFLPLHDITDDIHKKEPQVDMYEDSTDKFITRPTESEEKIYKNQPDIKIRFDDIPERKLQPITDATDSAIDQDDFIEESENNIIYKPV